MERQRRKSAAVRERGLALGAAAPRVDVRWSFDELVVQFPRVAVADGCPQPIQVREGLSFMCWLGGWWVGGWDEITAAH
jgi:hypothetical protein